MRSLDERMDEWGCEQARADRVPATEVQAYSKAMQATMLGHATRLEMAKDDFVQQTARPFRWLARRILGPDSRDYIAKARDEQLRREGWIP